MKFRGMLLTVGVVVSPLATVNAQPVTGFGTTRLGHDVSWVKA
jgi:hypothetical protein